LPLALLGIESAQRTTSAESASCHDADVILSQHTAVRPSRRLSAAYTTQTLLTGMPFFIIDLVVTSLCLLASARLVDGFLGRPFYLGTLNQLPVLLLLQMLLLALHDLYPGVGDSRITQLRGLIRSTVFSYAILASVNAMLGKLPQVEFIVFFMGAASTSLCLPIARASLRELIARHQFWGLRCIVIGDPEAIKITLERLKEHRTCGYRAVVTSSESTIETPHGVFINTDRIGELARAHNAPVVILASVDERVELSERLVFEFPSVVIFGNPESALLGGERSILPGALVSRINRPLPRLMPRITKRIFDLTISVPAVILLSPVFLMIGLTIKWYSPGPMFYGDIRIGQHGRRMKMWKFRTMVSNADDALKVKLQSDPDLRKEWEGNHKLKNDPRVVPVIGSAMRRYSIDEFPQLWNVVRGEMSLVGPRPVPPDEVVKYSNKFYEYTHMTPGLTGLWQVAGRSETTFQVRVNLVEYYAKNWSFWLDIWILARTPAVVLRNEGAY